MSDNNAGWTEYGKLVLTELERHNDILLKINEKLDSIRLQQALYEQEVKAVKSDVADHELDIKDLKKRVYKLEQGEHLDDAIKKYRRLIIGGAFAVFVSVAIPVVEIIIKLTQ